MTASPGTGKTHVATALAIEACHRGYQTRFYGVTELVTQLMEAREERQLLTLRNNRCDPTPPPEDLPIG